MKTVLVKDHEVARVAKRLEKEEAFTMEGLCKESIPDLANWLVEEAGSLTKEEAEKKDAIIFSGKQLNTLWGLTGDNRYPDNLTIICVSLEGLRNIPKLSVRRFAVGGRWLTDVRDNNLRREKERK